MTNIPDIIKAARESMDKAIENTVREFGSIRSGKATTHLLDTVRVEAYGALVPLNQVGMVSAPEPRMLTIQAFDKSVAPAIEKAIRDGDLGLNPSSQGTLIRVPIPPLSEERRKDLVRVVHKLAEEGRIAVRHARTDALHKLKKVEHVSEDDKARAEKDIQKHTDDHVKRIEELVQSKEAEMMEV